jgi:hypothetical protein
MAAHDKLSNQFKVVHRKGEVRGWHSLTLQDAKKRKVLADVSFQHYNDPHAEPSSRIEIDLLESRVEGKGHAQRLMEHMYNRYPKSHIDWGLTTNPASTHIAEKFATKYSARTSYIPVEDLD